MQPVLKLNKTYSSFHRSCSSCLSLCRKIHTGNSCTQKNHLCSTANMQLLPLYQLHHSNVNKLAPGLKIFGPFCAKHFLFRNKKNSNSLCVNIPSSLLSAAQMVDTHFSFTRCYRGKERHKPDLDNLDEEGYEINREELDNQIALRTEHHNIQQHENSEGFPPYNRKKPFGSKKKELISLPPVDDLTLPELSKRVYNLVPYVKRSLTLQKLVMLGVDLTQVQKVKYIPELLIKSDFDRDILPMLRFLARVKIPVEAMGVIFSKNPLLFSENVENLELRIGYLVHKKFNMKDVVSMAVRAPIFLLMDPHKLDEKLGFLQNTFQLTAHEVRQVALTCPKILPWRQELIADTRFYIKEFMGFNNDELKQIMVKEPNVYLNTGNQMSMVRRFEYLHNTMSISHQQIAFWPGVLLVRQFIIKNRHLFLLKLDRAQYDPCKENYVSLKALSIGPDKQFCEKVAKCSVNDFYNFLKTI